MGNPPGIGLLGLLGLPFGNKGSKGAERALNITEDNERLIGSVLLGNNLVNILAASLATALFTRLFGESGVALATLVMTLLVLIFAEVLPKTYAITNAERAASLVSRPIGVVVLVFAPVVSAVRLFVRGVLRVLGVQVDPDSNILAVREEIAGALQLGHSEGVVEKEDKDRILGALDLRERVVEEIMLHRSGIEMINADSEPSSILTQCLQSNHTRLPVFREVGGYISKTLLSQRRRRPPRINHTKIGRGRPKVCTSKTHRAVRALKGEFNFLRGLLFAEA